VSIEGNDEGLFSRVEIEINTNCNRSCLFCANSRLPPLDPPRYMELPLFNKVIHALSTQSFSGRISYHFYSEPLLHPNLEAILRFSHNELPKAEHVIYTNGDLLDDSKYESLVCTGISRIVISNYDDRVFPARPRQIVLNKYQIRLTNRGGVLGNIPEAPLKLPCFAPMHRLMIAYDGKVLICYEDACRRHCLGNLDDNSVSDVWFSVRFKEVRENLSRGHRDLYEPCRYCSNTLHLKYGQVNVNVFD